MAKLNICLFLLLLINQAQASGHGEAHGEAAEKGHGEKKEAAPSENSHGEKKTPATKTEDKEEAEFELTPEYIPIQLPPPRVKSVIYDKEKANFDLLNNLLRKEQALNFKENENRSKEKSIQKELLNLKQENLRNEELKKELGKTLDKKFQLDFKKLSELKTFYEKMEPKRAAAILNKMENIQMLVAIISQLSPSKASLILEKMEPEKTVKISEIYVGFDKNKPDDLVNTICEIKNQGYDKESSKF